ncbi:MAG TPA: hypothetical protein VHZ25_01545 [Acidobacteriaceae bacterium]|jgi:hypothetical protein|nr:hypothetical protein [Acidobacteriaceae bacterium]
MNVHRTFRPIPVLLFAALVAAPLAASAQATILHAPEAQKLLPDAVYYAGKSANTQLRNSAGLHYSDNLYTFAVLVDTSGYSTAVQEKYQGYLLTEAALTIGDHTVPPGAYGIGFVGDHFGVMDIGNHDLLQAHATRDDQMKRPLPLQILEGTSPGAYQLCFGRTCVDFRRK